MNAKQDTPPTPDRASGSPGERYRALRGEQIERLERNGCRAEDWSAVRVAEGFDADAVWNCRFLGRVRLGAVSREPVGGRPGGLTDATLSGCTLGDRATIHRVGLIGGYELGDDVTVFDVGELTCRAEATFGWAVGEGEELIELEIVNENAGRSVGLFDGMLPADAALWARHREDLALRGRLAELVRRASRQRRGQPGRVGDGATVAHARIVRDAEIGPGAVIEGADRVEAVTLRSTRDEPVRVGEGVSLVEAVVGSGSRVLAGSRVERVLLGENVTLDRGVRMSHCVVGDNSTIACCEVLHSLMHPAHEQHHNNSFLIAAWLAGQSNVAAGATIGSNHNSRAPDGEVHAGRGFWPGLCTSLKHNSRFASFVLLAKGDYPAELDVRLPFSLLSDDPAGGRLVLMPAYWWMYNLYALARSAWKYPARDRRKAPRQRIEFHPLAPDTAEEILAARALLERWVGLSAGQGGGADPAEIGRGLLTDAHRGSSRLEVIAEGVENSRRPVVVVKAREGYAAYERMLWAYATRTVLEYAGGAGEADPSAVFDDVAGAVERDWTNLGGQIVPVSSVDALRAELGSPDAPADWAGVHERYEAWWAEYPRQRLRHALWVVRELTGAEGLDDELWRRVLREAASVRREMARGVRRSRAKDDANRFRAMVYDGPEQMHAVVGPVEEDAFVQRVEREAAEVEAYVERMLR